jgi:hypothetical protein
MKSDDNTSQDVLVSWVLGSPFLADIDSTKDFPE